MPITSLPQTGFVRLEQILGNPQKGIPPIIPVKKSCWWDGVKSGRFPKPVKLGPRVTAWRVEDIRTLISEISETAQESTFYEKDKPSIK